MKLAPGDTVYIEGYNWQFTVMSFDKNAKIVYVVAFYIEADEWQEVDLRVDKSKVIIIGKE